MLLDCGLRPDATEPLEPTSLEVLEEVADPTADETKMLDSLTKVLQLCFMSVSENIYVGVNVAGYAMGSKSLWL